MNLKDDFIRQINKSDPDVLKVYADYLAECGKRSAECWSWLAHNDYEPTRLHLRVLDLTVWSWEFKNTNSAPSKSLLPAALSEFLPKIVMNAAYHTETRYKAYKQVVKALKKYRKAFNVLPEPESLSRRRFRQLAYRVDNIVDAERNHTH